MPYGLQPLNEIAAQNPQFAAGINGGYFWCVHAVVTTDCAIFHRTWAHRRLDLTGFTDSVCWGKSRKDAEQPVNVSDPNYGTIQPQCMHACLILASGIGDSLVKINGSYVALNCDKSGYNRPTVLVLNGTGSYIEILDQGQQVPDSITDAIASGCRHPLQRPSK